MTGEVIAGRYRLGEELGRGAQGAVWLAVDQVIRRRVAIKQVFGRAAADSPGVREARTAGRLNHPSVVTVHDVLVEKDSETGEDSLWIVMEHYPAGSAGALRGSLDPLAVVPIAVAVLSALRAAHRAGLIHRDVKPANILLDGEGNAVLADFGIALMHQDAHNAGNAGTPAYMSPQQLAGLPANPKSDLWALGVTLYELVEGRRPFQGDFPALFHAIRTAEPAPCTRAGPLEPVIRGLLIKDQQERLNTDEALRMLAEIDRGGHVKAPKERRRPFVRVGGRVPRSTWTALGLLAALGAVLGLALFPADPPGLARTLNTPIYAAADVAFSADGRVFASMGTQTGILLWDWSSGAQLFYFLPERSTVLSFALSPDGGLLAAGTDTGGLLIWQTGTHRQIETLPTGGKAVTEVAFSPQGSLTAVVAPGDLFQWRPDRPHRLDRVGSTGGALSMSFNRTGRALVISTSDGIEVWDTRAWRRHVIGSGSYRDAVFSPDGRDVAAVADSGDVTLFTVGGATVRRFRADMRGALSAVAFSPDGSLLATGGADDHVHLWDLRHGAAQVRSFDAREGWVGSLAFVPGRNLLVSGLENSDEILAWRLPSH